MIIDFHTHIFPDKVAKNAIPTLAKEGNVQAYLNGTEADLLTSMDKAQISKSVVCSIATKPAQFNAILSWSKSIQSERLVPFPSFHPESPNCLQEIYQIKEAGFLGIKLHPYYQDFYIDEERLFPIFEIICQLDLIVLMHTGYDIAFPRIRRADPAGILKTVDRFPDLKLVTSHLGAWEQWDEVNELLIGRPIYMDISYSLLFLDNTAAKNLLLNHCSEFILFGSDSPWEDQQVYINMLKKLELGQDLEEKILYKNAKNLLGS